MPTFPGEVFASLFKRYRLRSEFESLGDFSDAFASKGHIYEKSLYSHWQKGSKYPRSRDILIAMIHLFIERGGISSLDQANELLESVGLGYLTNAEIYEMPTGLSALSSFQAPKEVPFFTGRVRHLAKLTESLRDHHVVLIHSAAGRGKTTLAIHLAHLLRRSFPDGVLWYKLGTVSVSNILISIANTFGEDISKIEDDDIKASVLRSILNTKRMLIIYDNIDESYNLDHLIPSSPTCAVLMTALTALTNTAVQEYVSLEAFSDNECIELLTKILGEAYVQANSEPLQQLTSVVGNLPLAINILAKQIQLNSLNIYDILRMMKSDELPLTHFVYENKSLASVFTLSYNTLNSAEKQLLQAVSIFAADFSDEAASSMARQSSGDTRRALDLLSNLSFIESTRSGRWQMHPLVRMYVRSHIKGTLLYRRAGAYYSRYLNHVMKQSNGYQQIANDEVQNILHVFDKCLEFNYYRTAIAMWDQLSSFMWDTGYWDELNIYALRIYEVSQKLKDHKTHITCCVRELSLLYYWRGDVEKAEFYTREGFALAQTYGDPYLIAFAKERLGKIYLNRKELSEAKNLLREALSFFKKSRDHQQTGNTLRNLAEVSTLEGDMAAAYTYFGAAREEYEYLKTPSLRYIYLGIIYYYLGGLQIYGGELDKALDSLRMSIKYFTEGGERSGERVWAHIALGLAYEKTGDLRLARENFVEAQKELLYLGQNRVIKHKTILYFLLEKDIVSSSLYHVFFN